MVRFECYGATKALQLTVYSLKHWKCILLLLYFLLWVVLSLSRHIYLINLVKGLLISQFILFLRTLQKSCLTQIHWHIHAGNLLNLPNLININFRYNMISHIDFYSFSAVPTIREIDLWSNRLTVIGQFMFAGLPRLQKLWFWGNDIHTIEPGCFHDNTELRFLQLGLNDLKTLPESMFLMENHTTELNPLMCDVSICWFRKGEENGWITLQIYMIFKKKDRIIY